MMDDGLEALQKMVQQAIRLIEVLRGENQSLKNEIARMQNEIQQLKEETNTMRSERETIKGKVDTAISMLDKANLEDVLDAVAEEVAEETDTAGENET